LLLYAIHSKLAKIGTYLVIFQTASTCRTRCFLLDDQIDVVEYVRLLRSQIKDGEVKDVTHLDTTGVLKERISALEQEQVQLRCANTRAQKVIKDLEDGVPP